LPLVNFWAGAGRGQNLPPAALLDSLSANAYAMYLVHYVFVVWLQYALLGRNLFPIAKVAIVLSCTVILSWASSAAFNRFVLGAYIVPAKRAIGPVRD